MKWRSLRSLGGEEVLARDGRIGPLADVYFDEQTWIVCYLALDTRAWLSGREALVPPSALDASASDPAALYADLTRDDVRRSADEDAGLPCLHAGAELLGCTVDGSDGALGNVRDIVFDPYTGTVAGLVVDTLRYWPGRPVLVSPAAIESIVWPRREVRLRVTRAQSTRDDR